MTPPDQTQLLTAIMSALVNLQAVADDNHLVLKDVSARLDRMEASVAGNSDMQAMLDDIRGQQETARLDMEDRFAALGAVVGFTLAAASGSPSPLPMPLADHPVMERFILQQGADRASTDRTLVDWRSKVASAPTETLTAVLIQQQQPSPTDTQATRLMRFQLAATTRAELLKRGVEPVAPPASTRADDQSAAALEARSQYLARVWRGGPTPALYGEPELIGALETFLAYQEGPETSKEQMNVEINKLHTDLGHRIAAGERPSLDAVTHSIMTHKTVVIDADLQR